MLKKVLKKKESSLVIGVGRKFGKWEDKEDSYIIGSTLNPIQLSKKQMQILSLLDATSTFEGWKIKINKLGLSLSEQEFKALVDFYRESKLLVEIKGPFREELKGYMVVRNGVALGFEQGNWCVGAHNNAGERVFLSEEEYKVWISASGNNSILDVLRNIGELFKCDKQKAIVLFKKYAPIFAGKLLWTIEYVEEVESSHNYEDIKIQNLADNSIILPVGQEIKINGNEKYLVELGQSVSILTDTEFIIWTILHQQVTTIEDLTESLELDAESMNKEILPTLFEKNVIVRWDNAELKRQKFHFIPKGAAIKSLGDSEVIMKASPLAKFKRIPMVAYLTWSNIAPGFSQESVIMALSEDLQITADEAESYFLDILPFLIKNYLVDIVMKED
ncbi:hypothetical protein B14911_03484 [Bacillus sp. NRRL B-14911]|uniref:Uncharacterized protein n=1 Tax=Bacillus infantis NRRL B-14911 TaxID=1367477 RepID=U5LF17_9BACI|nr:MULTISPECIES: hypothetical protein [Bacillus]AGX06459.1 hypothetical protein N288_23100 [Bacillus infantis NRRL B-14911]EAR68613.1 hypothetical protein B14911_03484 [Bacillus sp. NRRL B-14911]